MNKKRIMTLVLSGMALAVVSFAWGQEKQPLQYHASDRPHPLLRGLPSPSLDLVSQPPEGLKLPGFKGKEPLFARWSSLWAPNGSLWIALDDPNEDGLYERLLIDSNKNARLDDDSATQASSAVRNRVVFPAVALTFEDEGSPFSHHLNFTFVIYDDGPRLLVRAGGWYEGTITADGKEWRLTFLDHNANGTFDDKSIDFGKCDLIQVGGTNEQDVRLVGNFIELDEKLYQLEVARSGAYVKLEPVKDVSLGAITYDDGITELVAGGENGMFTLESEGGMGKLQVGQYRVYGWEMERKDEKGNNWALKATSMGNPDVFAVSEERETKLVLGEPIISTINFYDRGRDCIIRHSWQGKSGEQIQVTLNGYPPPPAKVHIWNADRSYDRTFTFSHG